MVEASTGCFPSNLCRCWRSLLANIVIICLEDEATDTLLLSTSGTSLERSRVTNIVGEATLRHTGRRVTPHTFRHIVAVRFFRLELERLFKALEDFVAREREHYDSNLWFDIQRVKWFLRDGGMARGAKSVALG